MPNAEYKKFNRGFTLVESMIAIGILVSAITGATAAIQTGISSYIFSKDQITAFYLAQEGFELLRNMRDENSLNGRNWLTGIAYNSSDPCYFDNVCTVDPVTLNENLISCGNSNCPYIQYNALTGSFGYTTTWMGYSVTWVPTVFRREIRLSRVNANEVSISMTIDWSKGTINRQFKAKENIFNWQ